MKLAGLHSEECPHAGSFLVLPGSWAERVMLQGQGKRGTWHPLPINYSDLFLPSHLPSFSCWAIPATEKTIPRGSASLGPSFWVPSWDPSFLGSSPPPKTYSGTQTAYHSCSEVVHLACFLGGATWTP